MLEKLFKLSHYGTDVRTEVIAGITTFLTMAYIIFVNPSILAATGMDQNSVFVATCLAAAVGCFIMGLYANYPIAQAPGMGLNAFFTYTVVMGMGYSWQVALAAVFCSGVLFVLLSLFKIREMIINSIPMSLRVGIAAGIGLFLAIIALTSQGVNIVVANPATVVALGDITSLHCLLAVLGFFLTIGLVHHNVKGAVMISILVITAIGILVGDVQWNGIVDVPPSIEPTFLKLDLEGVFTVGLIPVIFAFLFVDLFDTAGTLVGVATKANLIGKDGKLPRLSKALLSDSTATVIGSLFGTSNTTSFVESTAGVAAGGRTGLTAVVVGIMFILALFFAPLAHMIPPYATTGALLYVAVLMLSGLKNVEWDDLTEATPAAVTCIMMPFTYSISQGIALGFISYALVKLLSGKGRQISITVWLMAIIFALAYVFHVFH
ncbi:NCS2 family permease [Vibrio viridaestus]|uniref:NCS2 family permease n=1 Tax=Vibrio viridaestus TaxID=2487322 RepID=A0A3N9TJ22_9VIBR|nr:NCS2 family permease [Vibrio viridaestus]RQW63924.1 NCS2 family permease [Vibrio viridaestus]